jgi:hypothetical protein
MSGIQAEVQRGIDANKNVMDLNRSIRALNKTKREQKQKDIHNAKIQLADLGSGKKEATTATETALGVVSGKAKPFIALGKTIQGVATPRFASDVANATEKYVIGGVNSLGDNAMGGVAKALGMYGEKAGQFRVTTPSIFKSDAQLLKSGEGDLTTAMRVGRTAEGLNSLQQAGKFLEAGVSKGATIGERAGSMGKLAGAGTLLSVGTGIYDAVEDLEEKKIDGSNTAEKVANISQIASGGLEAVGTAMDLTGVLAPVGVAFNLLGGIAGAVGGVADLIGEAEENTSAKKNVQDTIKEAVPQEQTLATTVEGDTGAEVKQSK